jgi:carnitine-CoA ligase
MRTTLRNSLIHPFSGCDLNSLIDARAAARGAHDLLIFEPFDGQTRRWTYAEFAWDTRQIAAGLARRGIRAGDRVLVHMENCPETILAWYAIARLGAIALTTNTRAAGPELEYFAEHAGASAAITQPEFAELVNANCRSLRWIAVTDNNGGEPAGLGHTTSEDSFAALYGDASAFEPIAADPMRELGIQYTSGTTSRPKGVVWTHANALWGFRTNALHTGTRGDDVHMLHMPLFHTNAQAYSFGAALYAGGTCVVMPRFSASRFWSVSLKHKCTWASMIPFCVRALMAHDVPSQHQYRMWGGGVCEPPTDAHFRVRTLGWWGMTETMTHGIVGDVYQPNRSMMIGKAAPEYGIAINRDDGTPVEPGEVGHLLVQGTPGLSLFKEYLHNVEATEAAFDAHGWFITGDRVILHDDGFIQFSDRDKDMLRVGGENVAASEIERVILAVPGIAECAVVAKSDAMRDEVPVAFVLPDAGVGAAPAGLPDKIIAACAAQLADFKVPVEVRLVDDFPRSTLEKIAKAQLRAQLDGTHG